MEAKKFNRIKDRLIDDVSKQFCAVLNSGSNGSFKIPLAKYYGKYQWDLDFEQYIEIDNKQTIINGLRNKLWAFSKDENDSAIDIELIVRNVCNNINMILPSNSVFERTVMVKASTFDNVFFCIKKINRKPRCVKCLTKNGQNEEKYVYDFYFQVGDSIIGTNRSHLRYFEKIVKSDDSSMLPIIKKYEPSEYNIKKQFVEAREKNHVVFEIIGEQKSGNALYKYMDLESALLCLERKVKGKKVEKEPNLRFVEPTSWDDQYEGRFYNACYIHDDGNGNIVDLEPKDAPFLYACCFSSKRENEAAWVLYSHNRKGLASRCVEFKLNRMKLWVQLVKNLQYSSVFIGSVQYLNKEKIDHVHEKEIGKNNLPNEDYDKYFRPFTKECYLNLLLMKRSVFEHEKEVRVFIVPNNEIGQEKTRRGTDGKFPENVKPRSIYVNIDWVDVIEEVKIDNNCTEYEIGLLQNKLNALAKKKKKELGKEDYDKLLSRLQLKKFDPYKDESLSQGPITIVTN